MGGDHGPSVTIPAALSFLNRESDAELILVGLEDVLRAELKKHRAADHPRITILHASEQVTMDDPLEVALRRKKDSSMRVAIEQVKDGKAQAIMPNQKDGPTYVMDLGANVDCEPHHLHQFAIMGSVLVHAMEGIARPTIGLLNVGTEDIKGNEVVKATSALLQADHERGKLNFYGNVEGNDIFKGTTDVVICDGFVGNVALKAVEGVAGFFKMVLTAEFKRTPLTMLGAVIANSALKRIRRRLNPARYNGASLLGLRGLVFKSHGSAEAEAFEWAIRRAFDAAKNDVQQQLADLIAELMPRENTTIG